MIYRPSFKNLQCIATDLPNVPIMALTATAPPDTLQKLKDTFQNAAVLKASINRPNISLHARRSKFGGQLPASVTNGRKSASCMIVTL